jgi:hypothetical protein
MSKKYRQAEPEHYSWDLGTPDNAVKTKVIVDPYSSNSDYVYEDDWKQDYPEAVRDLIPDKDPEIVQEYYNTGIDPYKDSFRTQIDDKEVVLPTVEPTGKRISEDEAVNRYLDHGLSLGERVDPKATAEMAKALYEHKLRQMMNR